MGEPYRGKGYVTEAAKGVIEFAFYKMELNRVEAKHMVGNEASGKVLQKT
ncbi:MAG: GNAT family N-acetyltransferase [Balneolaceae bacterium]|nr:GNAT family N-acetyltransferase [Balneolaceae bacterium]